jgi:hypothetical protein
MQRTSGIGLRPNKKPARWLSFLVLFGVILVSGTVVADVVLVFTVNHSLGANASSPFQFQGGANYAAANALGFVSNSYPGVATTTGVTVTTTISGVASVPVELFDMTEFATSVKLPAKATFANVNVPAATVLTPSNVVCAYAFISTAAPSFGVGAIAGAPAGRLLRDDAGLGSRLGRVRRGCHGADRDRELVDRCRLGIVDRHTRERLHDGPQHGGRHDGALRELRDHDDGCGHHDVAEFVHHPGDPPVGGGPTGRWTNPFLPFPPHVRGGASFPVRSPSSSAS